MEGKKMGRPYTDRDQKSITKRARMTEDDVAILKYCCEALNQTESDIIRLGIRQVYKELLAKQ